MKKTTLKLFCAALLTSALPFATNAATTTDSQVKNFKKALTSVPAPEMAAKAASLVTEAAAGQKKASAVAAVRAVSEISPSSTIATVGAIARSAPEIAADAAATAAVALPKSAGAIAKAAAAGAPAFADKIVLAVCQAVPKEYASVAIAVSQAVPGASKKILIALSEAVPPLKIFIDRASAEFAKTYKDQAAGPSVAAVIAGANSLLEKTANNLHLSKEAILAQQLTAEQMAALPRALPPQAAPILGPPFQPGPGQQTEITGTVPAQSRPGYSAP